MSKFFLPFFFFLGQLCAVEQWSSLAIKPPMNVIYHPVSTENPEAQASFNRGLTNIFAFNHDLAFREFEIAAKLDPNLAMAYWGMALALGQNVNADVTPENEIKSYHLMQKALQLSSPWPEERDYIAALAVRYTNDPSADLIPLRYKYRDAMKKLTEKYPEDLDALSLYAESNLDLDPWKWWSLDGKPLEGTEEAIAALNFVLRRNPDHLGANHYAIHAWEESPYPENALMSAHRLEVLDLESGHLLHMPTHIFILVGDYESALRTDNKAIAADRAYIKKYGMQGHYPLHYLSHNLYVLARIYMLMEDFPNAKNIALELQDFIGAHYEQMPDMGHFALVPLKIYLYFNKWQDILHYHPGSNTAPVQAFWHYARATAFANLGDLDSAQREKELMLQANNEIKDSQEIANNPARKIMDLAEVVLEATFARVQNNIPAYIDLLTKAVAQEDRLFYDEPPAWYAPIRQKLGAALIQQQRYSEAENLFRQSLNKLQRNGRSLFGLWNSLKLQGKRMDAYWVEREMNEALKYASQPLQLEQF